MSICCSLQKRAKRLMARKSREVCLSIMVNGAGSSLARAASAFCRLPNSQSTPSLANCEASVTMADRRPPSANEEVKWSTFIYLTHPSQHTRHSHQSDSPPDHDASESRGPQL